jgi:methionyl-tRNA formyltransferase
MKTLLFTDNFGITQLSKNVPKTNIIGIVGASIRPQYFDILRNYSRHLGVPFIIQPEYKSNEYNRFYNEIFSLKPDIFISHSYSMLVRKNILEIVNYNSINIHTALLPLNRGPNPLQWAIIKGEKITGVTMHYMTDKIDEGDIIAQIKVKIDFTDTWVTLSKKIEQATDELLYINIPKFYAGKWVC